MSRVRVRIFPDHDCAAELQEGLNRFLSHGNVRYTDHSISTSHKYNCNEEVIKYMGSIAYHLDEEKEIK